MSNTINNTFITLPYSSQIVDNNGNLTSAWRIALSNQLVPTIDRLSKNSGDGGGTTLNGLGFVKANGTTISYDNSSYYPTSNPSSFLSSMTYPNLLSIGSLSNSAGYLYNNGVGTFSYSTPLIGFGGLNCGDSGAVAVVSAGFNCGGSI